MSPPDQQKKPQPGSQTLARGLRALVAVTESRTGLTTQEVADRLDIHRSIAYRLLQTFVDFGFIARGEDGVYRPGARLAAMSDAFLPGLREIALPSMRRVAEDLRATIILFIAEGNEAVAIAMVEPTNSTHHISFRPGMRTPLDRGSAAYALGSGRPMWDGEPAGVTRAREQGFSQSTGEIAPGAHGIGALVPTTPPSPLMCVQMITYQADVAERAGPLMVEAATQIGAALA